MNYNSNGRQPWYGRYCFVFVCFFAKTNIVRRHAVYDVYDMRSIC